MTARLRRRQTTTLLTTAGLAIIFALIASGRILTFDESYWLVLARRILAGDLPYVDLYDNKGPLLYAVFAMLEVLPGPFEAARNVAVGLLVGSVFLAGRSLAGQSGSSNAAAVVRGVAGAAMVFILSSFALTTELFSVTLVAAAFALFASRKTAGLVLVVLAAGFDPRSLLFVIAYLIKLPRTYRRRPEVVAILGASIAAVSLVLVVPALRYSIVELSAGTRFLDSWVLTDQLVLAAACILPLVALGIYGRAARPEAATTAIILVGLAIGVGSLFPFGHYWTYLGLVPFVLHLRRDNALGLGLVVFPLLIPLLVISHVDVDRDLAETASVAGFASTAARAVDTGDGVLVWSSLPQTSLPFARQTMLRAANVNYLGWDSSRYETNTIEFGELAARADILVIEGPLDSSIPPSYRPAAQLLVDELEHRGCDPRSERPFVCETTSIDP